MATSVELNEQSVPLKSGEQASEGNVETGAGTTSGEEAQKPKKSWFGGGKKKAASKQAEGEAPAEASGDGKDQKNSVQGKRFGCPFRCFGKSSGPAAEAGEQQQPQFGIDLTHRDDRNLQTSIDLSYEDIYGEPDSIHSLDKVWSINQKIFVSVRSFFYKLFALIFFIPLAIVFGLLFALVSATSVFVFVPVGKLLTIPFGWVFKAWSFLVTQILNPIFQSVSHAFSNVKISRYGLNTDPTAVMST